MASTGDERGHAPRGAASQAQRVLGEANVIGARHGEDGRGQRIHPVPRGHLGSRSTETQARGEARGAVAQTFAAVGRARLGQSVEHRSAEPAIDERAHVAGGLELVRQRLVGHAAALPKTFVLNTRRDPDEDQTADRQVGAQRHMESDACPERVTEHATGLRTEHAAHRLGHQAGSRRQVGAHGVRSGMSGQVDGHHAEFLLELLAKGTPESARLGEAVQHHQWPARAAYLDMEWHVE